MEKIFNQIKSLRKNIGRPTQGANVCQRAISASILNSVIFHKKNLPQAIAEHTDKNQAVNMSWIKEACYGTLRRYHQLQATINCLVHKPIPAKHHDITCLLLVGLYQLEFMDIPDYAAVNETVAATKTLKKSWAKGLCNKILRRYLKQREDICKQLSQIPTARYAHPQWLIEDIQSAWPEHWEHILDNNNIQAPLFLRLNQQCSTKERYQDRLNMSGIAAEFHTNPPFCIKLHQALPVESIPGFADGCVSVQDISGQEVIPLLDLQPGHNVLDACAAPGSKTCYILEQQPSLNKLVAIDVDADRLIKIKQNMVRLKLPASLLRLVLADATHTKEWWDGQLFDRILLDVPCSATGVIRRHPDIKILRKKEDIQEVVQIQQYLLRSLWPLLAANGRLVYTTCSILPEENERQIEQFIKAHPDAKTIAPTITGGIAQKYGHQYLPEHERGDGFFYSILTKQTS